MRSGRICEGNTSWFFLDGAEYITIRNRPGYWGENRPGYFKYDIDSTHVNSLEIVDFKGTSAFPSKYDAIKK